jgi:hypothetical protein
MNGQIVGGLGRVFSPGEGCLQTSIRTEGSKRSLRRLRRWSGREPWWTAEWQCSACRSETWLDIVLRRRIDRARTHSGSFDHSAAVSRFIELGGLDPPRSSCAVLYSFNRTWNVTNRGGPIDTRPPADFPVSISSSNRFSTLSAADTCEENS